MNNGDVPLFQKRFCLAAKGSRYFQADFYIRPVCSHFIDFSQNPSAISHDDAAFAADNQGNILVIHLDKMVPRRKTKRF